jgi:hypothetical protein
MKYAVRTLLLSVFVVAALSCDKATPTAPSGSILTISANPSVVTSANGTSTITVTGRRSNGSPLADGTEIRLSTNLGNIEPIVRLDRNGTATTTLRGDGRVGKATVTASASTSGTTAPPAPPPSEPGTTPPPSTPNTGSGILSASIDVEIGSSAKTMTLQATPTKVPVDIPAAKPVKVRLLALLRDARGLPLSGAGVNFVTQYGILDSGGRLVTTNAQGEARDSLTIRNSDLTNEPPTIRVTAQTADSAGALVSATFDIEVRTNRLQVSFTVDRITDNRVKFNSRVTGGSGRYRYSWDFGDNTPTNAIADPEHTYAADASYFVTLTVTDTETQEQDSHSESVTIPFTSGS